MSDSARASGGDAFSFLALADGGTLVYRDGRRIAALNSRDSARLASLASRGDEVAIQHFLAKATGNYRRGNER